MLKPTIDEIKKKANTGGVVVFTMTKDEVDLNEPGMAEVIDKWCEINICASNFKPCPLELEKEYDLALQLGYQNHAVIECSKDSKGQYVLKIVFQEN